MGFHTEWQSRSAERLQEKLAVLPLRDGDLDCEALGRSPDEFTRESANESQAECGFALAVFLEEN